MEQVTPPPFQGETPPPAPAPRPEKKFSDTISFKLLFIVILTLVLLIPDAFIYSAISERESRQRDTMREISEQWSCPQTVTGPMLVVPFRIAGTKRDSTGYVTILPSALKYDAALKSQTLRRGIYEDVVYNSKVSVDGTFDLATLQPSYVPLSALVTDQAVIRIGVSDLRGIERISDFTLGAASEELSGNHGSGVMDIEVDADEIYIDDRGDYMRDSYLSAKFDIDSLVGKRGIPYSCTMELKGSHSMSAVPVGKATEITISGDCATPSFNGMFLPSDREVKDSQFKAVWHLNAINRDYPQVFVGENDAAIASSAVTADLLLPVDRYQKTERAIKYAVLVILLTFIGVLFAETMLRHRIYVFQYLLVGLALILFYSLLLSLAEHMAFGLSYLIAAVMTVGLVGLYMVGVLRNARVAGYISALLAVIYGYIFVLLNLETYALLAGSLGLFIALAAIMYASLKMDWKSL